MAAYFLPEWLLRSVVGMLVLLGCCGGTAWSDTRFDAGETPWSVRVQGLELRYRVFALFVLPGERVELTSRTPLQLDAEGGVSDAIDGGWAWTAPAQVGRHRLELRGPAATMRLNVFVMRPASEVRQGRLGAYRIGEYAKHPFRGLPVYRAPTGFVEVWARDRDLPVAPHFTLGQFLSKQASGWPKYLVLRPELLIKLERILKHLNEHGIRADTLTIMSGYRTPWYNAAIGNHTSSSRHLYGGAADIFVDVAPPDGVMDDLDGDGRTTNADADYLRGLLDQWSTASWWQKLSGGLAAYGATAAHGPFVHIDARGYRARWGRRPDVASRDRR